MSRSEFRLPDVGEGLTEAEIVTWRVAVGDTVAVNEVIVEIETAKSLVELPSPFAGRVASLLVAEGVTVPVGTAIIAVDAAGDPASEPGEPAPADGGGGTEAGGQSGRLRPADRCSGPPAFPFGGREARRTRTPDGQPARP